MKPFLYLLLPIYFFACAQKKEPNPLLTSPISFAEQLSNAVISCIDPEVVYQSDYVKIDYPNGDVPPKTGVCTDVVIRAYRKLGIDLQQLVHEDIQTNFDQYPLREKWGAKHPDSHIDHRRVPNLEVFFTRKGKKIKVTQDPNDYQTGDLVTWMVRDKFPHIGVVTHLRSEDGKRPLLVHNLGKGQILEDCLLKYKIVGHFQYHPH